MIQWRGMVGAAVIAVVAFASVPGSGDALAQAAPPAAEPQPANIDRNGVLILVRSTILALDHANKTGNYTVLRDLGSPGFQRNSVARLAEIFASHRTQRLDLGAVAVLEPQLTILPRIENGMLRMAGFFPSVSSQVEFDMLFAPVDRQWRLFGISLNLVQGGPAAPESEPEPEPEPDPQLPLPPLPTFTPEREGGQQ